MIADAEHATRVEPKAKVFISYSRKDMSFVDQLEPALKARGFEPLIDRTEIYAFEDWWKRIEALIGQADTIVFVISPDAVASEVAQKEVAHAASLNKRFAPIVCRQTPDSAIPEPLRRLNFIFFDQPDRFEAAADQLAEALRTDLGWIRQHTEFGEAARRWGVAGRPGPRGLLLRSPTLEEAEHWIASRPSGSPEPTEETRAFIAASRLAATQRRNVLTASLGAGLLVALVLAGLAFWQRNLAVEQRGIADEQRTLAEQQRNEAQTQRGIAEQQRSEAETQRGIADQQRGLAVAQRETALNTQSHLLSVEAARATGEGDMQKAILLSLEALRGADDGGPQRASADAEKTLLDALFRNPLRAILRSAGTKYVHAAFTFDASVLVVVSEDGKASFWAVDNSGRLTGNAAIAGPTAAVTDVFADPARPILVFRGKDDSYFAFNFQTGKTVPGVSGTCSGDDAKFAFDAAGKRLFVYCADVSVFNLDTGKVVRASGKFDHFALAPKGELFAVSADQTVKVMDGTTAAQVATWKQSDGIMDLGLSYDAKTVFTSDYEGVQFRDARTGKVTHAPLRTSQARTFDFMTSPTDDVVVADGDDGREVWNIERMAPIKMLSGGAAGFLPNGYLIGVDEGNITLWEFQTEGHTGTKSAVSHAELYLQGGHDFLASSADGKKVATLTKDGDIYVWSSDPAMLLRAAADNGERLGTPAVFSTNGKIIATTAESGIVTIWDAATLKEINHVKLASPPASLVLSADARRLVYINEKAEYDILDVATLKSVKPAGLPKAAYAAAFSPDGEMLALGGNKSLSLWKLADGSNVQRCTTGDNVGATVWPDDGTIAYAMDAGSVALLAPSTCQSTRMFSFVSDKTPANADLRAKQGLILANLANRLQIWSEAQGKSIFDATREQWPVFDESGAESTLIDLLPGGRVIVGKQPDGTLTIYDLATKDQILAFDADTGDCCSPVALATSPSGDRLMTLWSERGAFRLRTWQMLPTAKDAAAYAENIVPECLAPDDRKTLGLDAAPPRWCIEMNKRPYDTQDWRQWLTQKDAGQSPPLPGQ